MKQLLHRPPLVAVGCLGLLAFVAAPFGQSAEPDPVRILVVTGGHGYETNQFNAMFEAMPGVVLLTATHPEAHGWLKQARAAEYDVLVLYDMWQDIPEPARRDFVARLAEGKGLVALHHSLANYQDWPEFEKIIGGRYNLEPRTVNGEERPASTYLHDVALSVRVADEQHPVTRGLVDFEIHDETYGKFDVDPGARTLLTTEEPTSGPVIAWAKPYRQARVVYIQLGHDHLAFENPNYRRLVRNAIRWTAKRN